MCNLSWENCFFLWGSVKKWEGILFWAAEVRSQGGDMEGDMIWGANYHVCFFLDGKTILRGTRSQMGEYHF